MRLGLWFSALGLSIACSGVAGCSAKQAENLDPSGGPHVNCLSEANVERVRQLLGERKEPEERADYTLATGDLLAVTIYSYRPGGGDFSSDVRIDDRGYLSLPMVGPIHAAGLSLAQLRREVVHALRRADVLREPLVSVFLKDFRGQQVVVLGAVNSPGMYPLSRGRQTLVDVLSMAGGLAPTTGNAILIRPAAEPGSGRATTAKALYDTDSMQGAAHPTDPMISVCIEDVEGNANPDLMQLTVQGGDVIVIPQAGHAFIDGEVDKPGPYPIARGFTITQLVSTAGGFTFPADTERIKLIRPAGAAGFDEWSLNLDEIQHQAQPDIVLERNDRVVVPYRLGRKIAYGVYQTITAIVRITIGGALTVF